MNWPRRGSICDAIAASVDLAEAEQDGSRRCDALFNALQPSRVLLIADGAPWIWKRFTTLIEQGAIACPHPVIQLLDFYHAVEHLGTFAEACTFWPRARRTRWRNHARQLLRAGKIETVFQLRLGAPTAPADRPIGSLIR